MGAMVISALRKNIIWLNGANCRQSLNAELHTISQSGIGGWSVGLILIMPKFMTPYSSAVGKSITVNGIFFFRAWTTDLVVLINLMQPNKGWLIDNETKTLQPTQRKRAYLALLSKILVAKLRGRFLSQAQLFAHSVVWTATQESQMAPTMWVKRC